MAFLIALGITDQVTHLSLIFGAHVVGMYRFDPLEALRLNQCGQMLLASPWASSKCGASWLERN
jgi:hypothetical protein